MSFVRRHTDCGTTDLRRGRMWQGDQRTRVGPWGTWLRAVDAKLSSLPQSGSAGWCTALNCIDGAFAVRRFCEEGTTLCSSGIGTIAPWLQVDLGATQIITNVLIYNRLDCCQERLGNYEIWTGFQPIQRDTPDPFEAQIRCGSGTATKSAGVLTIPLPQHYGYTLAWSPHTSTHSDESCLPYRSLHGGMRPPCAIRDPLAPWPLTDSEHQ